MKNRNISRLVEEWREKTLKDSSRNQRKASRNEQKLPFSLF